MNFSGKNRRGSGRKYFLPLLSILVITALVSAAMLTGSSHFKTNAAPEKTPPGKTAVDDFQISSEALQQIEALAQEKNRAPKLRKRSIRTFFIG